LHPHRQRHLNRQRKKKHKNPVLQTPLIIIFIMQKSNIINIKNKT